MTSTVLPRVAQRLLLSRPRRGGPVELEMTGTALWTDVRGFTALTARYDDLGAEGIEDLHNRMNRVLSAVVEAVLTRGGDVLHFEGDGMLAVFDAADGDDAHRAAAAAFAICADVDDATLRVGAGLGSGAMRFGLVGGVEDRWSLVTIGGAIDDARAAESLRHALPVVSVSARDRLRDAARLSELDGRRWAVEAVSDDSLVGSPAAVADVDTASAVGLVPRSVQGALRSGRADWISERRRVSVLFAVLDGLASDPPLGDLNGTLRSIQAPILQAGGDVLTSTFTAGRLQVMGAFGLPRSSHEDDARRALRAGDEIRRTLAVAGGNVAIGVSTGWALCGPVGSGDRQDYGVLGDSVNLGARLMQGALARLPPTSTAPVMWCDHETTLRAPQTNGYAPLPALPVKGRAAPIALYRVGVVDHTRAGHDALRDELVGRNAERSTLVEFVSGLEEGERAQHIWIEADAGLGKSQLLAELSVALADATVTEWSGFGDSVDQATPYGPWAPIFASILGIDQDLDEASAAWAIEWWLQTYVPDRVRSLPLLSAVTAFEIADNDQTAGLQGKVRADETRRLLIDVLRQASREAPTCITLEDAHWFDTASWALLAESVRELDDVSFVVTSRPLTDVPAPIAELAAAVRSADRVSTMHLSPLDAVATAKVGARAIGVESLPDEVAETIGAAADGNPFYARELALALRDTGQIEVRNGRCIVPADRTVAKSLPETLHATVTSRIDQLRADDATTVKVASVLGRRFSLAELAHVHPGDDVDDELRTALDAICERKLLESIGGGDYEFTHAITRDVAYTLLLRHQRRELHERAAEATSILSSEGSSSLSTVAHHWSSCVLSGGGPDAAGRMTEAAIAAAQSNLQKTAILEAATQLATALTALDSLESGPARDGFELALTVMRAVPLTLSGGWASPEVVASYERAAELSQQMGPSPQLFQTLVGVFTYRLVRGEFAEAYRLAIENLEVAEASGDPDLLVEAYHDRGTSSFYSGRLPEAERELRKAIDLYDPAAHFVHAFTFGKDPGATARAHLAMSQALLGRVDDGLATAEGAHAHANEWFHAFTEVWMLTVVAIVRILRNEPHAVLPIADEMIRKCEAHGFPNWLAQGLVWRGWALSRTSDPGAGVASIIEGREVWQMTGSRLIEPFMQALLADAYRCAGDLATARRECERGLAISGETGEKLWDCVLWWVTARIDTDAGGRPEPALRATIDAARASGSALYELRALNRLAELGELDAATAARRSELEGMVQ